MQYKYDTNYKRSQFRNQIRQRQIQQRFQHTRLKYAQSFLHEQRQNIIHRLDKAHKKQQWLCQKAYLLSHKQISQWYTILRQLLLMTSIYKQKYGRWAQLGIIHNISLLFGQQYKQLQLIQIGACILQEIFYHMQQQNTQLLQILAQNNFFINITHTLTTSNNNLTIFLQLINTILYNRQPYLTQIFVQSNIIRAILHIVDQHINNESDQILFALSIGYRLVKGIYSNKNVKWAGNVIDVLISMYDRSLAYIKRQDCIRVILKAFAILGKFQKQSIFSQLYYSKNLIDYLIKQIVDSKCAMIRSSICNILASILTSSNPKYHRELVHKGLLDKLLTCSKIANNHQQCLNSILKILSNIISTSIDLVKVVHSHQIFPNLVIYWSTKITKQNNHEDAIYILCTMIQYKDIELILVLIRKYNIFDIFIQSLKYGMGSVENCLQILNAFIGIIRIYNQIQDISDSQTDKQQRSLSQSQNCNSIIDNSKISMKLVDELQSIYNIYTILQQIEERYNNKKVQKFVSIFLEELHEK